jgi:hypothetical protein
VDRVLALAAQHSAAVFSGSLSLDGDRVAADPLGFGVQGHNCGYRHRGYWRWAHAYFGGSGGRTSTLEALVYDMPLGLVFRKAVLWHGGRAHVFRHLKEAAEKGSGLQWTFEGNGEELRLAASFGMGEGGVHRAWYVRTDCSGSFPVLNNSLARATVRLRNKSGAVETLETFTGAVLEMGGDHAQRAIGPGPADRQQSHMRPD